uniref:Uncharacterized protein n=1 Tax=Lygus hesperus TaxID=30085 RepID=A0A0A9XRM8_LYGHE
MVIKTTFGDVGLEPTRVAHSDVDDRSGQEKRKVRQLANSNSESKTRRKLGNANIIPLPALSMIEEQERIDKGDEIAEFDISLDINDNNSNNNSYNNNNSDNNNNNTANATHCTGVSSSDNTDIAGYYALLDV